MRAVTNNHDSGNVAQRFSIGRCLHCLEAFGQLWTGKKFAFWFGATAVQGWALSPGTKPFNGAAVGRVGCREERLQPTRFARLGDPKSHRLGTDSGPASMLNIRKM